MSQLPRRLDGVGRKVDQMAKQLSDLRRFAEAPLEEPVEADEPVAEPEPVTEEEHASDDDDDDDEMDPEEDA